MSLVTW